VALEVKALLTQGSFDFGGANSLGGDLHFEAFKGALALVLQTLSRWFGVTRARWEEARPDDKDWLLSKFLKGKVPLVDGVDIGDEQALSQMAREIYFGTEDFDFRIVLWSDAIAVAVEGCSDPVVFSFAARARTK